MPSTPPKIKNLHYGAVQKWIEVCDRATQADCENFKVLFQPFGAHTTTLGQIQNLIDFVSDGKPTSIASLTLDSLFHIPDGERFLRPTRAADALTRFLRGLEPFYTSTKKAVWRELRQQRRVPPVRLGASQTIGLRLLSSILSIRPPTPEFDEPDLTIDNSPALIQQLHLGSLDLVLSWGPESFRLSEGEARLRYFQEPDLDVRFMSSGYETKMVLIASPRAKIWLNNGADANSGYWNRRYEGQCSPVERGLRKPKLGYNDLDPIYPREIRFSDTTRLIYVPSWNQPEALSHMANDVRQKGFLYESSFYDEALSLVRMNTGISAMSEVFLKRRGVVAFRLEPREWYTREIGIYYNTRVGLSATACCLAEFIREYLRKFNGDIRDGEPPSFGHPTFTDESVESFVKGRDWTKTALELYPAKPS